MAYLYQRIMDVPNLTGDAGARQRQLYERLGSPMGAYSGSMDQNTYLLNQINQGNFGAPQQGGMDGMTPLAPPSDPMIEGTPFPVPNKVTPFEEVLPYEKVFNQDMLRQLAEEQLRPEIDRNMYSSRRELDRGLAGTGGWRMGVADTSRQNLKDYYDRAYKEQVSDFTNTIEDYTNDWYNRQYESYYQNPARFKLPTLPKFTDYMQTQTPKISNVYKSTVSQPTMAARSNRRPLMTGT